MKMNWGRLIITLLAVTLSIALPQNIFAQTTIRIEGADSTAYMKNDETGEDEIVLKGSVSISVESGSSKTTITASVVTYNRVTDMLYAQGNVSLVQTGGSAGSQNISADSLLFNTATLEGVFDNGRVIQTQSDAINLPSGSTLVVSSEIFGRDSSSTIAFKKGELTFCDAEDPHWKIKASNIWLLPGGEFAFFNAVLYVGHIPVFYLPGFYYPKDELIFNPTVGYDNRAGYFLQTTTYVLGRKPLNASSGSSSDDDVGAALFNFMRSSTLKEQVREGLVLHNLDEDYKGDTSKYIKVMADYYSNLGAMVGVEGVFNPKKFLTKLTANVQLGFSNTVFYDYTTGTYMPYSSKGYTYYDGSNFMGLRLPFRYAADLSLAFTKPFSFTLSMPMYSDPYFKNDFGNRSEYMDWIGFLMNGTEDSTSTNTVGTFSWQASGSYKVPLPDSVKPYINQLAITSLSSSLSFSNSANTALTNENGDNWTSYTPEKYFYYPSQINPVKFTGKISGTLVSVNTESSSQKVKEQDFPVELEMPEELMLPEQIAELKKQQEQQDLSPEETAGKNTKETSGNNSDEEKKEKDLLVDLPSLAFPSAPSLTDFKGLAYSLTYSVTPTLTSQITYSAKSVYDQDTGLASPESFDWSNYQSTYLQLKSPVTLNSSLSFYGSFFSMDNNITFNPVFQAHPALNGYTSESEASLLKSDYAARKLDVSESNDITFRPFLYTDVFKNTSLSWKTNIKVLRTEFLGDSENPEWNYLFMDVTDKESITTHSLSANFSAVEDNGFSQSLVLSTTLPPQTDAYSASLSLTFPYVSVGLSSGIEENTSTDADAKPWIIQPFQESVTAKFLNGKLSFTQSFNYSIENSHAESFKFSSSWKTLQLAYIMAYTNKYNFNQDSGWVPETEKSFLPSSVSLSYSSPSKTFRWWKNRITLTPTVGTSIVYDCLRPTNSYFRFVPKVEFKVNDSVALTFSSESKNSVIYRYVQNFVGSDFKISGETNPLVDLINSFAFWGNGHFIDPDQTLRKSSGFKLKSLNMTLTHNLHDWDLNSSVSVKPRLTTNTEGNKVYDFSPYFTFSVSWRPMSSLKTEIVDEYGTWQLNP